MLATPLTNYQELKIINIHVMNEVWLHANKPKLLQLCCQVLLLGGTKTYCGLHLDTYFHYSSSTIVR